MGNTALGNCYQKENVGNVKVGKFERGKVGKNSQNYPDEFHILLFVRNVLIVEPCGLIKEG